MPLYNPPTTGPAGQLGYAYTTADFTTTNATATLITGLSVSVTVPSGGRALRITGYMPALFTSGANQVQLFIYSGTTVAGGILLQNASSGPTTATTAYTMIIQYIYTPSVGSQNYFIACAINGGSTFHTNASSTVNPFILVEGI